MQRDISLKEQARRYVIQEIEQERLREGDKVTEASVSRALGMSRTPVREALIQLAGDGYLEGQPQRGFRVRGFDEQNMREVFEMLGPLDGRAALLAVPHMTEEDLAQMRFLCDSMELAVVGGLTGRYHSLQREFHFYYIARCGNERLRRSLEELYGLLPRKSYERDDEQALENLRKANDEHREMLRLLSEGKALELQDYVRDVHWALQNATYAAWGTSADGR